MFKKDNDKGFTLVELLVVVIIIAVLAAIAIPVFINQKAGAQESAAKSDLASVAKMANLALANGEISTFAGSKAKNATVSYSNVSVVLQNTAVTVTEKGTGAGFCAYTTDVVNGKYFRYDSAKGSSDSTAAYTGCAA